MLEWLKRHSNPYAVLLILILRESETSSHLHQSTQVLADRPLRYYDKEVAYRGKFPLHGFEEVLVHFERSQQNHVMGICLGMQLLCRSSEEGDLPGLGLIDADVRKFRFPVESKLKVPHMGWNVVSASRASTLLPVRAEKQRFYFVHSYKVVPDDSDITIGIANYGGEFCAAFQQGNIFGVQFHPEKSHRFGMELMRRFIEL